MAALRALLESSRPSVFAYQHTANSAHLVPLGFCAGMQLVAAACRTVLDNWLLCLLC
jgi:hypothetical protein